MKIRCAECLYCIGLEDKFGDERHICVNNDSEHFMKEVDAGDTCGSAVDDTDLGGEFEEDE